MPALPTTNLRLHVDASDTDKLFTTFQSSGVHTGTPGDGGAVQIWDDEGDGATDFCLAWEASTREPNYRSTTPLMLLPCLDFDGSADIMGTWTQTVASAKAASNFIANNAFTLLIACYPEAITLNAAASYNNHLLIGDNAQVWGIYLKDNSGTKQALFYNFDTNEDVVAKTIGTGNPYVLMMRHESGNIYGSVNGGSESSVASGDTHAVGMAARIHVGGLFTSQFFSGRIGEIAIYNAALTGTPLSDAIAYFTDKWVTGGAAGPKIPVFMNQYRQRVA